MPRCLPKHLFTLALLLAPVLCVFSAMTMTALFILLAAMALLQVPRGFFSRPMEALARHRHGLLLMALLFDLPLISFIWSITPKDSFTCALGMVALTGGALIAGNACKVMPAPTARTAKWFAGSLLIACLLVMLELLPGGGLVQMFMMLTGNEDSYFLDKTINRSLCALAMLVWPAMLGLRNAGYTKAAWLVVLPFVALPVFVLHSLSAKMGVVAGAMVWAMVARFPQSLPKALRFLVPAMLLLWPAAFSLGQNALTGSSYYERLPVSSQHRVEIWHFTLGKVAEKPLLGWGMNTARSIPGHADFNEHGRTNMPLHPHNSVMQVLLEQGIIGLLLSVAAVALLLRRWQQAVTAPGLREAAGASALAYIAIGFTAFGLWQTWWVATGLMTFILLIYFSAIRKTV